MLPRADITGTRPVVLIEASVPANAIGQPRQETLDRLLQLTLGKEYQAQVLSRFTDGNFLVKVDNAVASMKLPPGTKSGDTLDLTLLATQPRPTFLLGRAEAGATTSLSNAGRLIDNMLQMAQQNGASPAVIGRTPLLPSATAATIPTQIASAMQQAVTASGLFYESHVAQWAAGNRPLSELLREPAAKRAGSALPGATSSASPAADADETQNNELTRLLGNVREWVGGERQPGDVLRAAQARHMAMQEAVQPVMARALQQDAPVIESARLLNQQLDTLEQRRFMWQGELFPGQPLEWEVADDTPQRKPDEPEAQAIWNSTVRFSMPTLGTISATIRLSGDHVQLQITTADEETAHTLREHAGQLATALDAAGSTLDTLLVRKEG